MNLTSIKLTVNGAQAWATVTGPLTSGMVGLPVTIEYDDAWDGLTKNLVCRCSPWGSDDGETRTILNVGETAAVAHEVMQAGMYLHLGVEGFSGDGKLVIPTTWARCKDPINPGANTGDDLSADPTLPVWGQLQAQIGRIEGGSIPPEQLDEIRACAGAAERAEENAVAASRLAADHADTAQAAAVRAEAAVNVGMTTALADYFTHVMPRFDDANGLAYVNAVLVALGAEPRGEGGGSGGEEVPDEPDQPGGEGGSTTGDALPTDGLMAYFDLRNLGDKANVTVGTTKGVPATQGSGALYSWDSQPIKGSDEYGAVLARAMNYNPDGLSAEHDMGDHFTVVVATHGGPSTWSMGASNVYYATGAPGYVTADGTGSVTSIPFSGDKTGYNTQVYCIDGTTQTMYLNAVEVCRFDGADYDGFVRWAAKPTVGTIYNAGTTVAAAFYSRALTEAEIVEVQAFMKTLEVTA
jgi:hypothetical protein